MHGQGHQGAAVRDCLGQHASGSYGCNPSNRNSGLYPTTSLGKALRQTKPYVKGLGCHWLNMSGAWLSLSSKWGVWGRLGRLRLLCLQLGGVLASG